MLGPDLARAWFFPRSILVVGASAQRVTLSNVFLRRQREFGYRGRLYALHPSSTEIEGIPSVPTIAELPEPVDYAYIAIAAGDVPPLLRQAAGRIRVAQVISSGFREAGEDGKALEAEMVRVARAGGIRLVGPNCMGSYSPAGGLTMVDGAPGEPGDIGVVSQSGVAACDVIKMGALVGGRFSQVLSIGNCADVDPVEVCEHFVSDSSTRVIGLYLEGLDRGHAFLEVVRRAEGRKPMVVLKGGLTDQGKRSVHSHTGALAADHRIWHGLAAQFGLVLKSSIEEFVGTLVGFSRWTGSGPPVGRRCCLVGPGGVLSVLGTDLLRRHGLEVPELSAVTLDRLGGLRLPPGSSVRNPIDTPVGVMEAQGGKRFGQILRVVAESGEVDWVLAHISIQNLFSYLGDPETALEGSVTGLLDVATEFRDRARWGLVLRTNRDPSLEPIRARYCQRAASRRIPTFTSLEEAVSAITGFVHHGEHAREVYRDALLEGSEGYT